MLILANFNSYFGSLQCITLLVVLLAFIIAYVLRRMFPAIYRSWTKLWNHWNGVVVIFFGIMVIVFGSMGFGEKHQNDLEGTIKTFYEIFQIFAFNVSPNDFITTESQIAMFFAILFASTLAAQGILFLFQDSSVKLKLLDVSGHVVVCGLGKIGRQLVADLIMQRDGRMIVVLEPDEQNPNLDWAREQGVIAIVGDATKKEYLQETVVGRAAEVFVVTGSDESNIECILEIRDILSHSRRRSFWFRKRAPLKCFVHILDRDLAEVLRNRSRSLERTLKLQSPTATGESRTNKNRILQQKENYEDFILDVEVFNALERTARRLLEDIATSTHNGRPMLPKEPNEVSHFLILGFESFGQTLALQLAELAHFENCKRLRLTIADQDIQSKAKPFIARNPGFGPAITETTPWEISTTADDWSAKTYRPVMSARLPDDSNGIEYVCNAQYVEYSEATDDEFLEGMIKAFAPANVRPVILVCFEDDRQNFSIAERLRAKLVTMNHYWPIFVWIPRQRELSQLLRKIQTSVDSTTTSSLTESNADLHPFGQCYGSVSYDEVTGSWTEWLARQLHFIWEGAEKNVHVDKLLHALNANDDYQSFNEIDWYETDLHAQQVWTDLDEWRRIWNRSTATHSVLKAASLGVRIVGLAKQGTLQPQPFAVTARIDEQLLEMEHYRWCAERLIAGWKYEFSAKRNDIRKTRWQITPWGNLDSPPKNPDAAPDAKPTSEKKKDEKIVRLFLGLIRSGKLVVERTST